MDLKEFATDFMTIINDTMEIEGTSLEETLASEMMEYLIDSGEVGAPQLCSYKARNACIHAYDYNEESNSLDFFMVVPTTTLLGKINSNKVNDAYSRMYRFYAEACENSLSVKEGIEEDLKEVVDLIQSCKNEVTTLRLFVLTNGLCEESPSVIEGADGKIMDYNIWDIQRIYQQNSLRSGKEIIEIDFPAVYDTEIPCLKLAKNSSEVDGYLAIIPGLTLARIYRKYQQSLLEKNVRTFLQFKAKVNQGIRKTLQQSPEMFFFYNNGISTTASDIDTIEKDGSIYVTRLKNWQIVNGGQTTASISSLINDKNIDLSEVYVPMKISIINNIPEEENIVAAISCYANSQTAVKNSDFSANDPFLVNLERFSRSEWVPNGNHKSVSKWYFERTRGQYLDEMSHLSSFQERMFRIEFPKQQKIVKTDIAKYETCWKLRPDITVAGAEKCYDSFVRDIRANPVNVTAKYYHRLIAKTILFKSIDKLVKAADVGGYKTYVNSYVLASISLLSKKMLNLDKIWETQKISAELVETINKIIPIVFSHITEEQQTSGATKLSVRDWCKRVRCFDELKPKLMILSPLPDSLLLSSEEMIEDTLNVAQKAIIQEAWAVSANTWFAISKWTKEHGLLSPLERKMAYSFGTYKSSNRIFSYKQASIGLKIIKQAKESGFIADNNK